MVRIAETCLNVLYQHGLSSAQFQFCFERAKHDLLADDMACDAIVCGGYAVHGRSSGFGNLVRIAAG